MAAFGPLKLLRSLRFFREISGTRRALHILFEMWHVPRSRPCHKPPSVAIRSASPSRSRKKSGHLLFLRSSVAVPHPGLQHILFSRGPTPRTPRLIHVFGANNDTGLSRRSSPPTAHSPWPPCHMPACRLFRTVSPLCHATRPKATLYIYPRTSSTSHKQGRLSHRPRVRKHKPQIERATISQCVRANTYDRATSEDQQRGGTFAWGLLLV